MNQVEREVKLQAELDFELPELAGLPDGARVDRLPALRLTAAYFDTPDLRLARSGATLRHRVEAEEGSEQQVWTLKLPEPPDGVTFARREISWPGGPEAVPAEALALIRATALGSALGPVARLVTDRRRLAVCSGEGDVLAEIDDDRVAVEDGPGSGEGFREIEVELAAGVPASVARAVMERLVAAGATAGPPSPKLFRALGPVAQEPPDVVAPELGSDSTGRDLVVASIARTLATLAAHDPGLRIGDDIEHVHRARVSTRRLRSDLRTFRPLLDPEWIEATREELKWAGTALGDVRDADVLGAHLRAQAESLGLRDDPGVTQLLHRLSSERSEAHARLLGVLDSERYLRLLARLRDAVLDPPLDLSLGNKAGARADRLAPKLVRRAWKRIKKDVKKLGKEPSDPELHEVRKRAKALRYAAEAVAPVVGKPAAALASKAKAVQDVLGELQDAVVAEAWLRDHGRDANTLQSLVADRLREGQQDRRSENRAAWPETWKQLRGKDLRAWLS